MLNCDRWPSCPSSPRSIAGLTIPRPAAVLVRMLLACGIALVVTDEIPAGTLLNADLHGAGAESFAILACVVHVSAAPEGGHVLGCNFIRELNENDLKNLM